mmetsp:Transcript_2576/g.2726  ORF Transcript_2576/g.2726 Transcript_2576/m.2726 type:complete len:222 (+) Transcript_2576:74-739(+)
MAMFVGDGPQYSQPNDVIYSRCQIGPPMPARLQQYFPERAFFQLRKDCINARSRTELDGIVDRYNREYNLRGALSVSAEDLDNTNRDIWSKMSDAFFGNQRVMVFNVSRLNSQGAPSQAVQYIDQSYVQQSNIPMAAATPMSQPQAPYIAVKPEGPHNPSQYPAASQYPESSQYPPASAPQYPAASQYPSASQHPAASQYPSGSQYPAATPVQAYPVSNNR